MKNIITIILLFLSFLVTGQNIISLCSYEEYEVVESNQKFQLFQNGILLIERSNTSELLLRINKEKNLLFLNGECINCSERKQPFEDRDFTAANNISLEVIPINDSLRITNNFRFSTTRYNEPVRSITYPDEDSIWNGMAIYNVFDFGHSTSCLKSNQREGTIEIESAFKYYKFCDLIIGKEYKLNKMGEVESTFLNFHKFANGKYISIRKQEIRYRKSPEDFPFLAIEKISEVISAYKYLNENSFGIQIEEKWLLCSYYKNEIKGQEIVIDTNTLDSIQSIPFFSPAYIAYYPDSSILQISHSRINGKAKFDTLTISNFFAEGIDPYINMEIILFSFAKNKHIIIYHSKGYPRYGNFKIYEGTDPTKFFDLEVHKLDPIPRNTMIIKTCHNKK